MYLVKIKTTLSDSVRDFFCDRPLGSAFQLYFILLYECVHVTESVRGNPKNFPPSKARR